MKRNDRGGNPTQANGMMLAELKHLKATLAAKDKRIKELEDQVKALKAPPASPVPAPVESKPAA
jgi:hypothetical protein